MDLSHFLDEQVCVSSRILISFFPKINDANISQNQNCESSDDPFKRSIAGIIDKTKSIVAGPGITSAATVTNTNTIILTAKDSLGNNIGVGGSKIYISITNQCTRGTNMVCTPVSGAKNVISSSITALMSDNGDGTYSYSYSVSNPGYITVAIYLYDHSDIKGEFYNDQMLTTFANTNYTSTLYYDWGDHLITFTNKNNVSACFTGYIIPTISDTYTFSFNTDDGLNFYIDGNQLIASYNVVMFGYISCSIYLEAMKMYSFKIEWNEFGGNAFVQMYWSSASVPFQLIPSSNFASFADVSSSPYQIQINCPVGYSPGRTDLLTCVAICGDGFRYDNEVCDDGNTNNGDGCRSDCMLVESGWICVGGNITHNDVCSKCDVGYEPNENKTKCNESSASGRTKILLLIMIILLITGALLNFINQANSQSIFSMLNQIQLIVLIPMIGAYVPLDVIQFITGLDFSLFNFEFINWNSFSSSNSFMSGISYDQPDTYLQLLSINDGSAIINIYSSIGVSLMIPIFHIIFCMLYCLLTNVSNTNKCKRIVSKFLEWVCFGWYIRYIMEAYLLMLISSLTEICRNNTSTKSLSMSFGLAIAILTFLVGCVVCSISLCIIARSSITKSRITSRWCHQCFSDIKDLRLQRCIPTLFFVRRILFCVVVIVFKNIQFKTKLTIYVSIQLVYMIIIIAVRPFEMIKNLILEMLNEVFYLVLCCLLFRYNTEDDWTYKVTQIYIWIMISNNILFVIISFIGLLIKKLSKKKQKINVKPPAQKSALTNNKENQLSAFPSPQSFNSFSGNQNRIKHNHASSNNINLDNDNSVVSFDEYEAII